MRTNKLKFPCMIWPGSRGANGYGQLSVRHGKKVVTLAAHRIIWEAAHGPIPPGMELMHKCDNPPCIRPTHLKLGTQKDNIKDCVSKERHFTPWRTTARV